MLLLIRTRTGVAVANPNNKATAIALVFIGVFFTGWNECIAITTITVALKDQNDIGAAGGVAGGIRMGISAILSAVYTTILNSRLEETIPTQMPPALVSAGLPASSVTDFITALTSGSATALASVEGITPGIIAAGEMAYKVASSDAYRTVFLSTIAINGIGIVLTFFVPNPDLEGAEMRDVTSPLHGSALKDVGKEKEMEDEV